MVSIMPTFHVDYPHPRNKKGEEVVKHGTATMEQFFSLGIKNVERECNKISHKYQNMWSKYQKEEKIKEYPIDVTYGKGLDELTLPFDLSEPREIVLKIVQDPTSESPKAALVSPCGPDTYMITIYLSHLRSDLNVIDGTPFDHLMYEELLHACGDNPDRGIPDGVIRPLLVGCEAVSNLLERSLRR
jgi:hypothetical protein